MRVLILDDDKVRHEGFDKILTGHQISHAYTYGEFVGLAKSQSFGMVCLDHDLGLETEPDTVRDGSDDGEARELNGQDAARWLADNPKNCPENIFIHSHNPAGAAAMRSIVAMIPGKKVVVRPYSSPR
jgi:hypothetical protein